MSNSLVPRTAKCKIIQFDNTYGGYLTPSEYLYLLSIGCRTNQNNQDPQSKWANEAIIKGDSSPMWCYFDKITFSVRRKPFMGDKTQK